MYIYIYSIIQYNHVRSHIFLVLPTTNKLTHVQSHSAFARSESVSPPFGPEMQRGFFEHFFSRSNLRQGETPVFFWEIIGLEWNSWWIHGDSWWLMVIDGDWWYQWISNICPLAIKHGWKIPHLYMILPAIILHLVRGFHCIWNCHVCVRVDHWGAVSEHPRGNQRWQLKKQNVDRKQKLKKHA